MPRFSTVDLGANEAQECNLDLRRDYQQAVDCLIQCDTLFKTFQEQLQSKDSRIAMLEDKVMELSLELASVKASQDHQKLKTMGSRSNINTVAARGDRRSSWTSGWTSSSENSNSSSNKSMNLGQLMNKTLSSLLADLRNHDAVAADASRNDEVKHQVKLSSKGQNRHNSGGNSNSVYMQHSHRRHSHEDTRTSTGPLHLDRPSHFPPNHNNHHRLHRSPSSEACLEALPDVENVIFPVSSFEVYSKGCCSRVRPIGTRNDNMQNADWPTFDQ